MGFTCLGFRGGFVELRVEDTCRFLRLLGRSQGTATLRRSISVTSVSLEHMGAARVSCLLFRVGLFPLMLAVLSRDQSRGNLSSQLRTVRISWNFPSLGSRGKHTTAS